MRTVLRVASYALLLLLPLAAQAAPPAPATAEITVDASPLSCVETVTLTTSLDGKFVKQYLLVDGFIAGACFGTSCTVQWNTTLSTNGEHVLQNLAINDGVHVKTSLGRGDSALSGPAIVDIQNTTACP